MENDGKRWKTMENDGTVPPEHRRISIGTPLDYDCNSVGLRLEHRWIAIGIPLDYDWNTVGFSIVTPLEYDWNTVGFSIVTPLDYDWNTVGLRLEHRWNPLAPYGPDLVF